MKPPPFRYVRAGSLEDALSALASEGDEARLLAGGQSLIAMMNLRLVRPSALVDVNGVSELDYIRADDATLTVGALTRLSAAEASQEVAGACPLMSEAIGHIAHRPIRNRGTVGGNLAHADPSSELPAVALAVDAQMVVQKNGAVRRVAADDFFVGALTTSMAPDEALTAIEVPRAPNGQGWSFMEVSPRKGDYALVGVAVTHVGRGRPLHRLPRRLHRQRRSGETDPRGGERGGRRGGRRRNLRGRRRRGGPAHRAEFRSPRERAVPPRHRRRAHPARTRTGRGTLRTGGLTMNKEQVTVTVNGRQYERIVEPRRLLSDFIREDIGLTGTHVGCEHGICGTCTVLMNGATARSCLTFAVQAHGAEITTVESLGTPTSMHPLQEAFWEHHGLQCGFCTPAMLLTAKELLDANPSPTREEIQEAISSNLCRCTGYQTIVEAVETAAARIRGEGQ